MTLGAIRSTSSRTIALRPTCPFIARNPRWDGLRASMRGLNHSRTAPNVWRVLRPDDDDAVGPMPASSSVAGGTILKLVAEVAALALSFVTGVITARSLGPSGKGSLATMSYLMV